MTFLVLGALFLAKPESLLDLEVRRRIYDYVERFPGMHLSEIARGTGQEMNHVKYHLTYMERHGLVSSSRDVGYWRFFPRKEGSVGWREQVTPQAKQALAMLRRRVPLHVVLLLLEHGELNQSQLQQHIGMSNSTLHYHLNRLEQAGLVVRERRGRESLCHVVDPAAVADLLVRYRPPESLVQDFLDAWEHLGLE